LPALLQPIEYRLAACDVLANFLRLSKFQSHVNLFFTFLRFSFSLKKVQPDEPNPHSTKSQNIVTTEDWPQSTWLLVLL
jgi:hypothetical protein